MLFAGTPLVFTQKTNIIKFIDLVYRDYLILLVLIIFTLIPGLRSDLFLNILDNNYYFNNI